MAIISYYSCIYMKVMKISILYKKKLCKQADCTGIIINI